MEVKPGGGRTAFRMNGRVRRSRSKSGTSENGYLHFGVDLGFVASEWYNFFCCSIEGTNKSNERLIEEMK